MNTTMHRSDIAVAPDTPVRHAATSPITTLGTSRPAARPAAVRLPIRQHRGREVPAAGIWPILTSSSVIRDASRTGRIGRGEAITQPQIRQGWLDLADDPTDCWLRIELDGLLLDMTGARVTDDPFGHSAWSLDGVADDEHGRAALHLDLRYHGVYRRGPRTWAWFSGTGSTAARDHGRRAARRGGDRLTLDLLFGSAVGGR